MKKSLILLLLTVFCIADAWAHPRSYAEMLELAKQHFSQYKGGTRSSDFSPVAIPASRVLKATKTGGIASAEAFYIFSTDESGYVIVSGDDQMKPVLGYATTGSFETLDMPANMRAWLQVYANEFEYSKTQPAQPQTTFVSTRSSDTYPETVAPLLGAIKWNQDEPFNNKCPEIKEVKTYTGCVATAMAQVMKYHNYPEKGKSSFSYTSETNNLTSTVDFSTKTFQWDQMLPSYRSDYTKANADAVAELMFCCGVSVRMDYGTDESGAVDLYVPDAMIDYFGYDSNIRYYLRDYMKPSEWISILKKELSEKRPVIYSGHEEKGGGHEFVVDGYDKDGLFHINWGWSGSNNGYFEFTALNPASPGIGGGSGGYNFWQSMITGMQKPTSATSYVSNFLMPLSIEVDKETIVRKAPFKLTVPEIYNYGGTFKGKLQAVLLKDGRFVGTLGDGLTVKDGLPRGYGYGKSQVVFDNLTIPTDVADGVYELYVGTKDNREANWTLAKGTTANADHYFVQVSSSEVKLVRSTVHTDFTVVSLKERHASYSSMTKSFNLSVKNGGEECFLFFGVALQPVGQTGGEAQIIAYSRNYILKGGEKTISLSSNETVAPGSYYAIPAYSLDGVKWESIAIDTYPTIRVLSNPTMAERVFLTQKIKLDSDVIGIDEPLTMTMSLKNSGGAYEGMIGAAIFEKEGSNYSVDLLYMDVFLDAGVERKITLSGVPTLKEGTYIVSLRYYTAEQSFGNEITPRNYSEFEFTVKNGALANDEIDVRKGISVYPSPAVTQLNVVAHEKLHRIEIINLSGTVVKRVESVVDAGNTYPVEVSGLTPGVYLIRACGEQKTHTQRFIKK